MLTQTDIAAAYAADGYVIIRRLYTDREVAEIQAALQAEVKAAEDAASGVHVWFPPAIPDFFLKMFTGPAIAAPVKAILGPDVEFLSAKPVVKAPHIRFASPWHQDRAYWHGIHKLSAWIALDRATPENGCLRVVKGGHRDFIPHDNSNHDNGFPNRLTDAMLPPGEIVDCVMDAGDAIFFHDLLPHCSYPNPAGLRRWCVIPTYRSTAEPDPATVWSGRREPIRL